MPIVRRKITAAVESTYGTQELEHEFYVKPTQVQSGDVVVKPDDLPEAMLADLAISHPKEFRAPALARGLVELERDEPETGSGSDEDDDEISYSAEQVKFLTASAAEAVAMVDAAAAAQDVDTIALYAVAEEAKEKPRKSVLEALAKAIGE